MRLALADYETRGTIDNEIERTLDYLVNLKKHAHYFQVVGPPIAAFLPLNQPLYATVCFGLVPSLMCDTVFVRPPAFTQPVYRILDTVLEFERWFPRLRLILESRQCFLETTRHIVDGVVFVGAPRNRDKVRRQYPGDVLFIANGAGHNPIIVGPGANIEAAVASVFRVTLYNQGQDCSAPNTIFVHSSVIDGFMHSLRCRLVDIEPFVKARFDDETIVGPNTDRRHLVRVSEYLVELAPWQVYGGNMNPATGLVYPAVFRRPVSTGFNYVEFFAPIFHVQEYDVDVQLRAYFDSAQYRRGAMYLTLFGEFSLLEELKQLRIHNDWSVIRESDLYAAERGFLPYGGSGVDASCLFRDGELRPGAILLPRDIYHFLILRRDLAAQELL